MVLLSLIRKVIRPDYPGTKETHVGWVFQADSASRVGLESPTGFLAGAIELQELGSARLIFW
jgi:hypothetical protein